MKMAIFRLGKTAAAAMLFWIAVFFAMDVRQMSPDLAVLSIFGGISFTDTFVSQDLSSVVKWTFFSSAPILVALGCFFFEYCRHSSLTLIRYRSILSWWKNKLAMIVFIHYAYLSIGLLAVVMGTGSSSAPIDTVFIEIILLIFPLYTLSVTLCCMTAGLFVKSYKAMLFTWVFMSGGLTAVGLLDNGLSRYAYGCFGMIYRSDFMNREDGFSILGAVCVMLFVVLVNILAEALYLKKHKLQRME